MRVCQDIFWGQLKLKALVYDILPWRKVPESDARSVGTSFKEREEEGWEAGEGVAGLGAQGGGWRDVHNNIFSSSWRVLCFGLLAQFFGLLGIKCLCLCVHA